MDRGRRLPVWLKMQRASGETYTMVKKVVTANHLNTICTSGNCPNIGECWNRGTATFMILGNICTRACKFCATETGRPMAPDTDEPVRLAETIRAMGLKHCVITSVDRDDLPDRGASVWALTVRKIREMNGNITIETLIPDFDAVPELIQKVIDEKPDVISHNIETVRRLTPQIRTRARYDRSMDVLRYISQQGMTAKSGFMVGLGENNDEVLETISDIYNSGCRIITIGQYLRPAPGFMEPHEYITPERFSEYRKAAIATGFDFVECDPLVRSSFHAENHVRGR